MKINYSFAFSCLTVFALFFSCSDEKKEQRIPQLPVLKVEKRTVNDTTIFPANVEGVKNIEIRPKIEGFIERIYVDEGAYVQKGDLLFELEAEPLQADAQAARDAIGIARADRYDAQVDVDKLVPLVEEGIISEVELKKAQAGLAQANSRLKESENVYRSAQRTSDYKSIKSPVTGRINSLPYRLGSLVGPTNNLPLTTVSQNDSVFVYFSMDEKDYVAFLDETRGTSLQEKIANFPEVVFELSNGNNYKQKGRIQTTTGTINSSTGSITFRAIFPNPDGKLTDGYSGLLKIPIKYSDVVVVPAESTYKEQTLTYLFRVANQDTIYNTLVNIEKRVGNVIIVNSGIKVGDTILAKGLGKVQDSAKIKPKLIALDSVLGNVKKAFRNE
ncbi:membrane fusion protein, multidrug efflux system [Nonlabens sp. Hel1_33_55]|uniref:efflux RND transporter periplasmic adaptor subunit n=1 Tax=Nonlabens sp. Hel1_33_55 TaxID=1336802 RepID=UPI000875DB7B|nr:efflux RND transporter periplasmic adaptor subunit [Nonlabens sp. Hel1_33_55]SCY17083.1 membrane fusion protein, multidrug efflux system [Nonlabens sp. Hel1_33_55]